MNAFIGSLGISKYEGLISPAYAVCRPIVPMVGKYYEYLFKTPLYLQIFDNYSYGIMIERNRLYFDNFKKIERVAPSLKGMMFIQLKNGLKDNISRKYLPDFKNALDL